MSNGTIPAGEIRFYDNYIPALPAEDYVLRAEQSLVSNGDEIASPSAEQAFSAVGPRFALDPAEIQSVFPPNNSTGTYGYKLPHIVLTQRALPWERKLEQDPAVPWLALLVFAQGELQPPAGAAAGSDLANPTLVATCPVEQLRRPPDPESASTGS